MSDAVKNGLNPWRWEASARRRLCWALAVILLVAGWRLAVHAKGSRLRGVAAELAAVQKLVKYPVPNHAGTKLLYAQSIEQGVGLYLLDIAAGEKQLVYQLAEGRILSGSLSLLEWSPDDTMLAYAKPVKGKKQEVVLCSALVGEKVASIPAEGYIKEFQWLSPGSFAYLNNSNHICVASRGSTGKWSTRAFRNATRPPVTHFAAISPTTVAWKQLGAIWMLDLATGLPQELWKPQTNRLVSCYYSRDNRHFIVRAENQDKSNQILALNPHSKTTRIMDTLTEQRISKVNWINGGKGYAYQCTDHWGDTLFLKRTEAAALASVFPYGEVIDFKARRDRVFIYGGQEDEPPGIWEHNPATDVTRCLVSPAAKPFSFGRAVQHASGALTNSGRVITYQVWKPSVISKSRKYPLVLGQTPYRWNPYPYAAARAGCWFVSINRKSWEQGIETWEEDVMAVYRAMTSEANIDAKRVFLYGHSAETSPICNLAEREPDLWKGALMLSPTGLPDLSRSRLSAMLIDAGELDAGAITRLSAYQTEAARAGVATRLVIHPGARHTSWSRTTEQSKVEEISRFLSKH